MESDPQAKRFPNEGRFPLRRSRSLIPKWSNSGLMDGGRHSPTFICGVVCASRTMAERPRRARASAVAAPAGPPPTITTSAVNINLLQFVATNYATPCRQRHFVDLRCQFFSSEEGNFGHYICRSLYDPFCNSNLFPGGIGF